MANMVMGTIGIDATPAVEALTKVGAQVEDLGNQIKSKLSGGNVDIGTDKASAGLRGVSAAGVKAAEDVKKVGTEGGKAVASLPPLAQQASKALSGMGDIAKQAIGLFGGGLLLKGVDGLIGGFSDLFKKGVAVDGMMDNLKLGFRTAGTAEEDLNNKLKASAKTVGDLSDKYAVSKGALNDATAAFLRYGGSTDNLAQKQELIIGLAKKGGIEFEAAARLLAKATDPENEANLKRLGIVLDKNATDTERFNKIQSKLVGTLGSVEEAAHGPGGTIDRMTNAFNGFKGAVGSALIEALDPLFKFFSNFATFMVTNVLPAFKSFVGIFKSGVEFLGPIIPILGALAAGLVVFTIATEASFAATAKTWVLEKAQLVTKYAKIAVDNASTIALQAATAAQWLWNAALSANPIGLVVLAVAALVAGFILLYKYVAPVREFFDGAFAAVVPVLMQVWDVIKALGTAVLSLVVIPFQILWMNIKAVWSVVSGLFAAFTGGAGSSKGALESLKSALEKVSVFLTALKAGIAGFQNVIHVFVETFGTIIDRLIHLDFSGAKEAFSKAGEKMGAAFKEGAQNSLDESAFDSIKENVEKLGSANVEIKAKISASGDAAKLADDLAKTEEKMKPLEVKVKAGLASPKEREEFDKLAAKAGDIGKKIAESVPEAVKGQREILTASGKTVTVYEVQASKVKEIGAAQKKLYEGEALANQNKYSANVEKLTDLYSRSKTTQAELFEQAKKATDPKQAAELLAKYDEAKKKTAEYGASLKDAYDKGREGGLLTEQAFTKVLVAQGMNVDEAKKFYAEQKKQAEEAEKVAAIIAKYKSSFDDAKKAADEMLNTAQSEGANFEEGLRIARKNGDKEEIKRLQGLLAERKRQQLEAAREERRLTKVGERNDGEARLKLQDEFNERTKEAFKKAADIQTQTTKDMAKADIEAMTNEFEKKKALLEQETFDKVQAVNAEIAENAKASISEAARAKVYEALEAKRNEIVAEASQKRIALANEEAKKLKEIDDMRLKQAIDFMNAQIELAKREVEAVVAIDEDSIKRRYELARDLNAIEEEKSQIETENTIRENARKVGKTEEEVNELIARARIAIRQRAAQKEREAEIGYQRDTSLARIAAIGEAAERERAVTVANARAEADKKLNVIGLSEEERARIEKEFQAQSLEATQKYIEAKYGKYRELTTEIAKQVNEQLEAERKANEAAREEYAKGTDELLAQLRAREIGYKEYTAKVEALRKKRDASENAGSNVITRIARTTAIVATKQFAAQSDKQMEKAKEVAATGKVAYGELGTAAAYTFASMIAAGQNMGAALLASIANTASAAIDLYIPQILGAFTAALGPFGVPAALAVIATVKGLLASASNGFEEGGYTGDVGTKQVAGVVHGREFVFNAERTKQLRPILEYMHETGRIPTTMAPTAHKDNGTTAEIRALRADVRAMGGRITTRQSVEVTPVLDKDRMFSSIRAEQRNAMRRC